MSRRVIAISVVFASVFHSVTLAAAEADEKIEEVLRRHLSTVSLLREVSLKVDTTYRRQGETDFSRGISYVWRWSRAQDKTRVLIDTNIVSPDGWAVNKTDTLFDRKKKVSMGVQGWDPDRPLPRPLKVLDPGRVNAGIDESYLPGHFLSDSGMVGHLLHFVFSVPIHPEIIAPRTPYVLDEFVGLASRADYDEVEDENRTLIRLRLHWDPLYDRFTDIFIDPAAGHLVRKVTQPLNLTTTPSSSMVSTVTEFREFDDGVVIPMKVMIKMYADSQGDAKTLSMEGTAAVEEVTVNNSLPQDAFDFQFPENALVKIGPPKDGKTRMVLWGPNNRPRQEIYSAEDIQALARAEALAPRRRLWGVIGASVAALLAVGAFIYWRWRTA